VDIIVFCCYWLCAGFDGARCMILSLTGCDGRLHVGPSSFDDAAVEQRSSNTVIMSVGAFEGCFCCPEVEGVSSFESMCTFCLV
jgi:hypothetical protein